MAEFVVVKRRCTKCGRRIGAGENACTCRRPKIERVEIRVLSTAYRRIEAAPPA